ncbi:MAG: proline--tRNA ligase [Deltaproteobacteria bacterium]|nr:proline--tRNA ligase [Deltaproteobacteria bacterium]
MAEKITPRSQDFSKWYQDVILQARLADYSPVKGCMVIRPNGYSIWEKIQSNLDQRIKSTGTRNAYFPLFIPESFIQKEAEHVKGFAPQCAVVTYAGAKDLEEKLIVRPTSETIINSMFSKWIQSYRDLPMLINQWANVVRWEMRTRLFLRTTEFLWQEGHTCHETLEEAEKMALKMLTIYTQFCEDVLAMPVVQGLKSENEKFAGALRTYCIEAFMQDKKALQAGTSHNLSSHFAKAFHTVFLDKDGTQKLVFQTSWGVSTRLIGGLVMMHSDDRGLILPPRVSSPHVVILPIFGKDPSTFTKIKQKVHELKKMVLNSVEIKTLPYPLEIHIDEDETKQAGWKFHEYELIGIPIRLELGPKDLDLNQVTFVRRDLGKKEGVPFTELSQKITEELLAMQKDLFEKAKKFRMDHTHLISSYDEFKKKIATEGGFYETSWCQNVACETKVKEETKATLRCILLDQAFQVRTSQNPCVVCSSKSNTVNVLFAISY